MQWPIGSESWTPQMILVKELEIEREGILPGFRPGPTLGKR